MINKRGGTQLFNLVFIEEGKSMVAYGENCRCKHKV